VTATGDRLRLVLGWPVVRDRGRVALAVGRGGRTGFAGARGDCDVRLGLRRWHCYAGGGIWETVRSSPIERHIEARAARPKAMIFGHGDVVGRGFGAVGVERLDGGEAGEGEVAAGGT
jgi:hypothetical protein